MPIQTHQISLHGLSGAVFWCTLSAVVFYVLGFATVNWETRTEGKRSSSIGLWNTCVDSTYAYENEDWFKATQAMACIGLALLLGAFFTMFLYMFCHSLSLNKTSIIIAYSVLAFLAAICMLVCFSLFGAKHGSFGKLHWSYALAVVGGVLTLIAGILGIAQMRNSNVV